MGADRIFGRLAYRTFGDLNGPVERDNPLSSFSLLARLGLKG
jgi:hypothetical protein